MNETAIRMEEQIISLFPGMETLICHVIGIKRQGFLFLPDGNLSEDADLEDILQFSKINSIKKILADIPGTEELPEKYKQAGFSRIYLYRCYQKEEKSSQKQED